MQAILALYWGTLPRRTTYWAMVNRYLEGDHARSAKTEALKPRVA